MFRNHVDTLTRFVSINIIYPFGHFGLIILHSYLNISCVSLTFYWGNTASYSQVSFRSQLKNSTNEDARHVYSSTRSGCNIQYDRFNNCREVLKEIRDEKLDKVNKLVSHSIVVKALWQEALVSDVKQWHRTLNKLPKNIFNFCIRYLNNTLPTLKNMVLWKKSENALCKVCYNTQTFNMLCLHAKFT